MFFVFRLGCSWVFTADSLFGVPRQMLAILLDDLVLIVFAGAPVVLEDCVGVPDLDIVVPDLLWHGHVGAVPFRGMASRSGRLCASPWLHAVPRKFGCRRRIAHGERCEGNTML